MSDQPEIFLPNRGRDIFELEIDSLFLHSANMPVHNSGCLSTLSGRPRWIYAISNSSGKLQGR